MITYYSLNHNNYQIYAFTLRDHLAFNILYIIYFILSL